MYCPAHFTETQPETLQALMREHPLGTDQARAMAQLIGPPSA